MTESIEMDGWAPGDHIIAAEMAVAGAVMMSRNAIEAASEILSEDDFFSVAGRVFAASLALLNEGKPIDEAAVLGELTAREDLVRIGGGPYLASLLAHAAPPSSVSYHAAKIAADSDRRRVHQALRRGIQVTESSTWESGPDIDAIRSLIDKAASRVIGDEPGDVSQEMIALLNDLENPPAALPGVVPPYLDLESLLTVFAPGQLIVVGARPSIGKSTLAVDCIRGAALRDKQRTLMFTLEMSEREVLQRMSSAEAQVSLKAIRDYKVTPAELEKLAHAGARISDAPLTIDDRPGCSLERIRTRMRSLSRTEPIGLVVIDYLQLLDGPKSASREQEVSALTRGLKLLAMEHEVPIMLLSQLNRLAEQRTDKRPQASDLRESGAIEQDSDVVILLHREDFYDPTCQRAGEADLIVAKNRGGPKGTVAVAAQLHYSRFVDMAIPSSQPPSRGHLRSI